MPLIIEQRLECDSVDCAEVLDVSTDVQPVIAGRKAGWTIVPNTEADELIDSAELTFCPKCKVVED